jgi:hypothetical protein
MRLVDLEPIFVRHEVRDGRQYQVPVKTLAEAQGVRFLCPKCFKANGGAVGTHGVVCWSRSRGVPDGVQPGPGRWTLAGTDLEDLTLNGDPPGQARSVQINGGCGWHGHITAGMAEGGF